MDIWWEKDEWYPVYTISDDRAGRGRIEITEEEYTDYKRVMKEFDDWQAKIRSLKSNPIN